MGITKTEGFSEEQKDLAALTKVLGHPARIAILQHLMRVDSCICGDIVDELPLAQPTISRHLKELKNAGLIQGTVEGTSICYCIHPKNWAAAAGAIARFFDSFQLGGGKCC